MQIEKADSNSVLRAASLLKAGRVVAFPTETVYGLGGDATNDNAVAEIFSLKGRPQFNPLIIHVSDAAMARRFVKWNARAEKLAEVFWPGPLTLVLKKCAGSSVSLLASAGGDTLGMRIPAHPVAQAIIAAADVPVAAPSANISGRVSPTTARHVQEDFGGALPLIVDGGACEVGIESTVIDISAEECVLLRPGAVTREQIEAVLGNKISVHAEDGGTLKSPGLLLSHYAPRLPVRLNIRDVASQEALLAFGPIIPQGAAMVFNLSESGNLKEAAARLFVGLHLLDKPQFSAIGVMAIPDKGIGIAINDRLKRAAH